MNSQLNCLTIRNLPGQVIDIADQLAQPRVRVGSARKTQREHDESGYLPLADIGADVAFRRSGQQFEHFYRQCIDPMFLGRKPERNQVELDRSNSRIG
jgi:hypothetical protein